MKLIGAHPPRYSARRRRPPHRRALQSRPSGPAAPWVSHSATFDGKVLKAVFDAGDFEVTFDERTNTLTGLWKPAAGRGSAPPQHNIFARPTPATARRDSAAHQERGVPQARVVRLAHASHFVWRSNEADVLREMRAFIDGLAPPR